MGYLYLFAGMICGLTKGYCGKRMSGKVQKLREIMLANTVRMFLCVLIGLTIVVLAEGKAALGVGSSAIFISLMCGAANAVSVVSWIVSVKNGAYMLPDIFGTLGLIVPIVLSSLFFGEQVKPIQCFGFVVLLVAVYVMCSYNNTIKKKLNCKSLLSLFLCGASNGIMSFSQKLYVRHAANSSIFAFNFYTYIFATVTLGICCLVLKDKKEEKADFSLKSVGVYIVIMSACLFMHSYFLTLAAKYLDAVQLYPLNTGMTLVLSSVMSAVFFKERITPKCLAGIILTFAALLIINVFS